MSEQPKDYLDKAMNPRSSDRNNRLAKAPDDLDEAYSSIEGLISESLDPESLNPSNLLASDSSSALAPEKLPEKLYETGQILQFKKDYDAAISTLEAAHQGFLAQNKHANALLCLADLAWLKYNQHDGLSGPLSSGLLSNSQAMPKADPTGKALADMLLNEGPSGPSGFNLGLALDPKDLSGDTANNPEQIALQQWAQARYLHVKGLIAYREGDFGVGVQLFKQASMHCSSNSLEYARILDSLGVHYERTGDFHRAVRCLQQSLELKQHIQVPGVQMSGVQMPWETAITLQILGRLFVNQHEETQARQCLENARTICRNMDDFKRLASLNNDLLKLLLSESHWQHNAVLAQQLLEEASAHNRQHKLQGPEAMTQLYRAYWLTQQGQLTEAQQLLSREVSPMFERLRQPLGLGLAARLQGAIYQKQGNTTHAIEWMGEAMAFFREMGAMSELAKTHLELGKLYAALPETGLAVASLMEALKVAEQHGLYFLTPYIEDELFKLDQNQWRQIVHKRATHERIFEKEPSFLETLEAHAFEATDETADQTDEASGKSKSPIQTKALVSLLRVGQAMAGIRDLDKLLEIIKNETEKALSADRCTVFLYDKDRNELWSRVASGLDGTQEIRFAAHLGLAGYVCKTGEVVNIRNAYEDPRFNPEVDRKTGYRTESLLCIPMRNRKMEIIGVFQVLNKKPYFQKADEDLLMAIAANAAVAIENATLLAEKKLAFESFIKTLSSTIDARDPITAGHSERVAEYAMLLGEPMHLSEKDMEALKYASLLHDIGKIGVKEEILLKDGRLTLKEYQHIQKHVEHTYDILRNIHFERHLRDVPEIAASHHEKMDGTGYFRGLKGSEIPLSGRILALSDVFDAITSRRHYRNRMPFDRVLGILRRDAGTHFDADCIEAFMGLRLKDLCEVLLIEKRVDHSDGGVLYLKQLNPMITVREYAGFMQKEAKTPGESEIDRMFTAVYHSGKLSSLA